MTPPPVRFGVIGAGWFASRRHLPEIMRHPGATLQAICRRDAAARETVRAAFDLAPEHAYADWQEMLEREPLDAVLIATPNALHEGQALEALGRGLHVLVEKPAALTAAGAGRMERAAEEGGLQLAVAFNPPHWAHCHRMREAVRSGAMGRLESAAIYWSGSVGHVFGRQPLPADLPGIVPPTMYRADPELNGGGYFMDGGAHLVSELLWVTEERPVAVTAAMDALPVDMRAAVTVEFASGAIATIASVGDSERGDRRVRNVFGYADGEMEVRGFEFDTRIATRSGEERFLEADLAPVDGPVTRFVASILDGAAPYSPGSHGTSVTAVLEAAYRSAADGRRVPLPAPGA